MLAVVAVVLVCGVVLAPGLGDRLAPAPVDTWPETASGDGALFAPEPVELVRFGLAVLGPLAVAGLLLFGPARRGRVLGVVPMAALAWLAALGGLAIVAAGWVARSEPSSFGLDPAYFSDLDLLVAGGLAAAVLVGVLARPARAWSTRALGGDGPDASSGVPTKAAAAAVVLVLTVLWVLPAVHTATTLAAAQQMTALHVPFTLADFAAFGNGATPGGDFAAQYSNLLPWVLHPIFVLTDYSASSFTVVMGALAVVTLVALWRTLAVTVGHEVVGAVLFVPVLALSLRPTLEAGDERTTNASLYQIIPERYLLPMVVAWLCARHLRGHRPSTPAVLFALASLAGLNNPEFGVPCLAATAVALLVGSDGPAAARLRTLALHLAAGLVSVVVLVAAGTLLRAGSLPDPALLSYFSRFFGTQGFGLQPMPAVGFHLVLYVTFAGALLLASARRASGDPDRGTWGMVAFAAVLGLGTGSYYAGRSNAVTLVALFPTWGLCVALLAWSSARWLLSLSDRRAVLTPLGAMAVLSVLGLGLVATDLVGIPSVTTQARRLTASAPGEEANTERAAERFIAERTEPGEPVLVLRVDGHLVARGAGVRNVAFLGHPLHLVADSQLDEMLRDLRAAGGRTVFLDTPLLSPPGLVGALRARGWRLMADEPAARLSEWRSTEPP